MKASDRLAAWLVTGPVGHFWSASVDIAVVWLHYGRARLRRRLRR